MALRITVAVIIIIFVLSIAVMLTFKMAGLRDFQFGSSGGNLSEGTEILRTQDGGKHWEKVTLSEERETPFPKEILNLTFHPSDPDVIFLGTKSAGLWKSTTRGVSWKPLFDSSRILNLHSDVYRISVNEKDPRVIYLAAFQNDHGRVLKSMDGGMSFREVYFVPEKRVGVFDVFSNPEDPEHAFIITGQGGLLETKNGGDTWRVRRWFGEALSRLLINPQNLKEIYVVTSRNKIHKSTDEGVTWLEVKESPARLISESPTSIETITVPHFEVNVFKGLFGERIQTFTIPQKDFSVLYMVTSQGILRSKDKGASWERLNLLIPPEKISDVSLAVHPKDPHIIFVGLGNQLHRSEDGGSNWTVDIFPTKLNVKSLYVHPERGEVMFVVFGR